MNPFTYRLVYAKRGVLRFVSHLDLLRLFEMALRRSGLPVRYTEGFNPRVRLSAAGALPVGVESECETLDIHLTEAVDPDAIATTLGQCLPEGIEIHEVRGDAGRDAEIRSERWRIDLDDDSIEVEGCAVDALLASTGIPFRRRRKDGGERAVDLRPHIDAILTAPGRIELHLRVTGAGRARPDEVLAVLAREAGRELRPARIVRISAGP